MTMSSMTGRSYSNRFTSVSRTRPTTDLASYAGGGGSENRTEEYNVFHDRIEFDSDRVCDHARQCLGPNRPLELPPTAPGSSVSGTPNLSLSSKTRLDLLGTLCAGIHVCVLNKPNWTYLPRRWRQQ